MFSNSDRWYFTKEQLNNSPSRRFGIDADKELAQRQQAANFIQDMGQRLQVTQLCINTAIVYMHRFYMFHSFTHFHRNTVATACLFLAAKVEEQPRKLEHIIKVAVLCLQKGQAGIPPPPPPPPERRTDFYAEQAQEVIQTENILLQTLGFDVAIDHPHTYVVKCCHLVGASKDLSQTSYFMASNSLHLTTMCLQYKPTVVACFCIHLACKWSNWEIPVSSEGKPWFYYVDPGVTQELLERLTEEFLIIFDKCPSRLKKRIMLLSHNQSTAGGSGGTSTALSNYPFDADCRKAMQKRREESAAAKQADVVFGGMSATAAVKVTDGFNGATGQNTCTASNVTKPVNAVSTYNSLCTNSGGTSGGPPSSGPATRHNAIPPTNVSTVAATTGLHSNSYSAAVSSSHFPLSASACTAGKSAAVPHKASSNNFTPASRQKVVLNNNINSNHNTGANHTSQTSSEHRKSATVATKNIESQQVRHHRKDGSVSNTISSANVAAAASGNGKYVAGAGDSLHSDIISNVVKEVVLAKQNEKLNCLKAPKKEKAIDYNNSKAPPAATGNLVQTEQKSHSIFSPTFSLTESDNSANDAMFFERSSSCTGATLDPFTSAMRAAASPPAPPPKNLNDRYLQRLQKQEQNKTSDATVCSNHTQIINNSAASGKEDVAGFQFASYDKMDRVAFDINDVVIAEDIVNNASSAGSPPAPNATLPVILADGSHCTITDNEGAQSDTVNNSCSSQVLINDVAAAAGSSDDVADTANDSSLINYDADGSCAAPHKKKKKHKEKDKHRDKEKKHHKEKKKHKEDKHHHHHHRHHHHHGNGKEYEEQSLIPAGPTKEIVEPIKITIPKEKLKDIPMRLKIKINKDQISNSSVTDSGPFKFKIGKEDGKRHTRKRNRADRGSDISADSYSSNSEDELRSSKRTNYYLC